MSTLDSYCKGKLAWFDEASTPTLCWVGYPLPAVVLPIATCLLFVLCKYLQYQERQLPRRQTEKYQQYDHDYLHGTSSFAMELLRIAACFAPLGSSLLIANYLTTCFGWLPMLGLDVEPPSLTGGYNLGCFSFLAAWVTMSLPALLKGDHRRAKRQPWPTLVHELIFNGEAIGWATTLQLAIWLFLRAAYLHL